MIKSDITDIDNALKDFPINLVNLIKGSLDTKNSVKKLAARSTLAGMGKTIIPKIHKLLDSENDLLRMEAAKIVELIADRRSIPKLISLLDDKEFEIRWIAAEGLIKIGRRSILPLLKSVRDGKSSYFHNKSTHHALLGLLNETEKRKLEPLLLSLENYHGLGETAPVEASVAINAKFKGKNQFSNTDIVLQIWVTEQEKSVSNLLLGNYAHQFINKAFIPVLSFPNYHLRITAEDIWTLGAFNA